MTETMTHLAPSPDIGAAAVVDWLPLLGQPAPPTPSCPDAVVVTGPAEGAVPAPSFEEVLERHAAEVHRFALRLTRNGPDADDLYQDVMLKAYRAFGRLPGGANHRAWLYRIAWNTFLSDQRRRRRCVALDEQRHGAIPAAEVDRAAGLDAGALLEEVAAFVEGLPRKQRLALVLRKHHGLGYAEIAEVLGSTVPATRGAVHHALRKLADRFADRL